MFHELIHSIAQNKQTPLLYSLVLLRFQIIYMKGGVCWFETVSLIEFFVLNIIVSDL